MEPKNLCVPLFYFISFIREGAQGWGGAEGEGEKARSPVRGSILGPQDHDLSKGRHLTNQTTQAPLYCFLSSGRIIKSILALNDPHCPFWMSTDNCFQKSTFLWLSSARSSLHGLTGTWPFDHGIWPRASINSLTDGPIKLRGGKRVWRLPYPGFLSCPGLLWLPGSPGWRKQGRMGRELGFHSLRCYQVPSQREIR